MIKKYYYSLVSMKYVYFMFGLPLMIFLLAFIETRKKAEWLRYGMIVFAFALAIVMFFYYKDKYKVFKQLKNVKDIQEYEKGGVVDRTWILEDRMLCCYRFDIEEVNVCDVKKVTKDDLSAKKVILHLFTENKEIQMTALDDDEASRFVAFLKKKNTNLVSEGIEEKGNGTLQELGAGIQV